MTIERRMAVTDLHFRDTSTGVALTGYASTFNQPYSMGWYTETVDPKAFQRTLGRKPDVRLLINHDGLPLARTTSGTLELKADTKGLLVEAELDGSDPDVQRLAPKMARGDINQMSFGFRTISDVWEDDMSKRTLRELDLNDGDVSVVTYPANPSTSAALRSGQTSLEGLTSALAALEVRGASPAQVVAVLERALRSLNETVEEVLDALDDPDAENVETTLDNVEGTLTQADDVARAAIARLAARSRALRIAG